MYCRSVRCAENLDITSEGCSDLKVCVTNSTTQSELMSRLFPEERLVLSNNSVITVQSLGVMCDVYASGVVERTTQIIKENFKGNYSVDSVLTGTVPLSRESLALVTNEDDVVFSKLVDAVVNAILYADEKGITQDNYLDMPLASLYSPAVGNDMLLRNSVRAVGNYQEIWNRHTNPKGLQRGGRNLENKFPFEPLLMTVHTWDRRPPKPVNRRVSVMGA